MARDIYEKFFVFLMTAPDNELKIDGCVIKRNNIGYSVIKVYDDEGIFCIEAINLNNGMLETMHLYDIPQEDLEKIFKHVKK